jgi:hypothetical protein
MEWTSTTAAPLHFLKTSAKRRRESIFKSKNNKKTTQPNQLA